MKKLAKEFLFCTVGAVLFVMAVNMVIGPLGLYNGGFVGIGRLAGYGMEHFLGVPRGRVDPAGVVYFLLNAPLFILAQRSMSRSFLAKTMYTVILQTVLLSLVPVPQTKWIEDVLTTCIVGGGLAGVGVGIILRAGSSGGGQDILGIYFAKTVPGYSVGKITLIVNGFVYGCCGLLFDIEVVIYSLIYTTIMSVVIDKMHSQNINHTVLILTKKPYLEKFIIKQLHRGITLWKAEGGYTNEEVNVGLVVLSKYEFPMLKRKLKEFDQDAFVVVAQGSSVFGHYEKRFDS